MQLLLVAKPLGVVGVAAVRLDEVWRCLGGHFARPKAWALRASLRQDLIHFIHPCFCSLFLYQALPSSEETQAMAMIAKRCLLTSYDLEGSYVES